MRVAVRASCRSRAADLVQATVYGAPNTVCENCWTRCVPAGAGVEQLLFTGGWADLVLACVGWRENMLMSSWSGMAMSYGETGNGF